MATHVHAFLLCWLRHASRKYQILFQKIPDLWEQMDRGRVSKDMSGTGKYELSAEKFHFKTGKFGLQQSESWLLYENIDSLHKLYINKIGLDFKIHVLDDQNRKLRLPLHKIVLAAHVDKLDPKLGNELDLTRPGTTPVNWALMQSVIEFLYTRHILVSETNVQDLMTIAKVLQLKTLRECCVAFLKKPSVQNAIQYLILAKSHDLSDLTEHLLKYTASHLPAMLQRPEVQFLDAEALHSLLEKEEAHSQGEILPLEALAGWLSHNDKDGELPKEKKLKLTKLINTKSVSLQDLQKMVEEHVGVLAIEECKQALFHDIKEKLFSSSKNWALRGICTSGSPQKEKSLSRQMTENFICAVTSESLQGKDSKILTGQCTDHLELRWLPGAKSSTTEKTSSIPGAMILHRSTVILEGRLYLLGGLEPYKKGQPTSQPSNSVVCYDFQQAHWLTLSPMLQGRHNFGVTAYNGLLYVIGGQGKGIRTLSSCESYIPGDDRWVLLTALSQRRVGIGVAAHNGFLFSAGGFAYVNGAKTALNTVERYDLTHHRWKRLSPLPGPGFAFCSMIEVNGHIYTIGGAAMNMSRGPLQSLDTILEYSDATDTWAIVAKLYCARHYAGVAALGTKIYVIGGINNNKTEHSVECFQCETRQIVTLIAALPAPVLGTNSCAAYSNASASIEHTG